MVSRGVGCLGARGLALEPVAEVPVPRFQGRPYITGDRHFRQGLQSQSLGLLAGDEAGVGGFGRESVVDDQAQRGLADAAVHDKGQAVSALGERP